MMTINQSPQGEDNKVLTLVEIKAGTQKYNFLYGLGFSQYVLSGVVYHGGYIIDGSFSALQKAVNPMDLNLTGNIQIATMMFSNYTDFTHADIQPISGINLNNAQLRIGYIWVGATLIEQVTWYFDGVIRDIVINSTGLEVTAHEQDLLEVVDLPRNKIQNAYPEQAQSYYPYAPEGSLGKPIPIVYGNMDLILLPVQDANAKNSFGYNSLATGYLVNPDTYDYLVAGHQVWDMDYTSIYKYFSDSEAYGKYRAIDRDFNITSGYSTNNTASKIILIANPESNAKTYEALLIDIWIPLKGESGLSENARFGLLRINDRNVPNLDFDKSKYALVPPSDIKPLSLSVYKNITDEDASLMYMGIDTSWTNNSTPPIRLLDKVHTRIGWKIAYMNDDENGTSYIEPLYECRNGDSYASSWTQINHTLNGGSPTTLEGIFREYSGNQEWHCVLYRPILGQITYDTTWRYRTSGLPIKLTDLDKFFFTFYNSSLSTTGIRMLGGCILVYDAIVRIRYLRPIYSERGIGAGQSEKYISSWKPTTNKFATPSDVVLVPTVGRPHSLWSRSLSNYVSKPSEIIESIIREEVLVEDNLVMTYYESNGMEVPELAGADAEDDYYKDAVAEFYRVGIIEGSTERVYINSSKAQYIDFTGSDTAYIGSAFKITNIGGNNSIDTDSFDNAIVRDYYARQLLEQESATDVINSVLRESFLLFFKSGQRYKLANYAYDDITPVATWYGGLNVDGDESTVVTYSSLDNIYTSFELNYNQNLEGSDYFGRMNVNKKECSITISSGDRSTLIGYCLEAYKLVRHENKMTIDAKWLNNSNSYLTAEWLFNEYVKFFTYQHPIVNMVMPFKNYIQYEIGDCVRINNPKLPDYNSWKYVIIGKTIQPYSNQTAPYIEFTLIGSKR